MPRASKLQPTLIALSLLLLSAVLEPAKAASFLTNSPMVTERYFHTPTLLPNGKVLVAGGMGSSAVINNAALYDPATGTWTATGTLTTARASHTATLLSVTRKNFPSLRPPD